MRKRSGLFLLFFILIALMLGFIFRYQQVAYTPIQQRYLDRWTGIEWIKSYTWGGLIRVPASFQQSTEQLTEAERSTQLEGIHRQDKLLTITWYVAVVVVCALIVHQLCKANH